MVPTSVYLPPSMRQRIEGEMLIRNSRDGATAWTLSQVIVDMLREHLGLPKPGPSQNGHEDE